MHFMCIPHIFRTFESPFWSDIFCAFCTFFYVRKWFFVHFGHFLYTLGIFVCIFVYNFVSFGRCRKHSRSARMIANVVQKKGNCNCSFPWSSQSCSVSKGSQMVCVFFVCNSLFVICFVCVLFSLFMLRFLWWHCVSVWCGLGSLLLLFLVILFVLVCIFLLAHAMNAGRWVKLSCCDSGFWVFWQWFWVVFSGFWQWKWDPRKTCILPFHG